MKAHGLINEWRSGETPKHKCRRFRTSEVGKPNRILTVNISKFEIRSIIPVLGSRGIESLLPGLLFHHKLLHFSNTCHPIPLSDGLPKTSLENHSPLGGWFTPFQIIIRVFQLAIYFNDNTEREDIGVRGYISATFILWLGTIFLPFPPIGCDTRLHQFLYLILAKPHTKQYLLRMFPEGRSNMLV